MVETSVISCKLWLVLLSKNGPLWSRRRTENEYSLSSHPSTTRTNHFQTTVILVSSPSHKTGAAGTTLDLVSVHPHKMHARHLNEVPQRLFHRTAAAAVAVYSLHAAAAAVADDGTRSFVSSWRIGDCGFDFKRASSRS